MISSTPLTQPPPPLSSRAQGSSSLTARSSVLGCQRYEEAPLPSGLALRWLLSSPTSALRPTTRGARELNSKRGPRASNGYIKSYLVHHNTLFRFKRRLLLLIGLTYPSFKSYPPHPPLSCYSTWCGTVHVVPRPLHFDTSSFRVG